MITNNDVSAYTGNVLPVLYNRYLPIKYTPCLSDILNSNSKEKTKEKESFCKKLQKYASQIALILSLLGCWYFFNETLDLKKQLKETEDDLDFYQNLTDIYEIMTDVYNEKCDSLMQKNLELQMESLYFQKMLELQTLKTENAEIDWKMNEKLMQVYMTSLNIANEFSNYYLTQLKTLKQDHQNILNRNIGLNWDNPTFTIWKTTISLDNVKFLKDHLFFDANLSWDELMDILIYLKLFQSKFPYLLETLFKCENKLQISWRNDLENNDPKYGIAVWEYTWDSIIVCKPDFPTTFPHEAWHAIEDLINSADSLRELKNKEFTSIYQYCKDHQMELWLSEYEISTPEECFAELYAIFFNMYILNQEEQFKEQFGEKIASFIKEFTNTFIKAFYKKDSNEESQAEESQKIGTVE